MAKQVVLKRASGHVTIKVDSGFPFPSTKNFPHVIRISDIYTIHHHHGFINCKLQQFIVDDTMNCIIVNILQCESKNPPEIVSQTFGNF